MNRKEANFQGFVKWFSELSNKDILVAGGKGASLAEMYNNKFPIPPGFIITVQAYEYFIDKAQLKEIRKLIEESKLPKELEDEILEGYDILGTDQLSLQGASSHALSILQKSREPAFVAVRSSATTEDLSDASFAGQQESFLNVKGNREMIENVKKCFSSLFTARAIYYRHKKGFSPIESKLAIVIQKMVSSDKSGVIFSMNPVNNKEEIMIEAVFGLGEGIVSGMINPDNYIISRNLENFKLIDMKIADKKIAIVRDASGENRKIKLNEEMSKRQVLSTYELKILSQLAEKLEQHYKKPQDIEFAISGHDIYIVQSRPITTRFNEKEEKKLEGDVLLSGLGASPGIASGPVKLVITLADLSKIRKGDVLVTEMTNPDMVVSMQKACAIITDEGGITSHASIVSREMGIPCTVGTKNATKKLKDEDIVTVDGSSGKVYEGKGETKKAEVKPVIVTKTKIKVIVDLPDYAERAALSGVKSVGLTRLEGIIAESGFHPYYFVKEDKMSDYIRVLFSGLSKIAAHFEEVWIRTSDIRSDEFRHLKGAPKEQEMNPMLGNHGVRFSLKHRNIMKAEIEAIKNLSEKYPNKIFGVMVPQLISLEELKETKAIAKELGIKMRREDKNSNLKIGIMVETPAAVQIINELCGEGLDFISFGTNDLTQYILAIDRNNPDIQNLYDEMNPAVLSAVSYVIRRCKKYNVETSICGQAASKKEMVEFLVREGIDSVSVNADAAYSISEVIHNIESESKVKNLIETPINAIKNFMSKKPEKEDGKSKNTIEGEAQKLIDEDIIERMNLAAGISKSEDQANSLKKSVSDNEDIESIILKELEDDNDNNEGNESADYSPGAAESKKDIPSLNEAIPVESEMLEEEKEN